MKTTMAATHPIHGFWFDCTFVKPQAMVELGRRIRERRADSGSRAAWAEAGSWLFTTCERVELYTEDEAEGARLAELAGALPRRTSGAPAVWRRLVEIGCGLRSRLLGERMVGLQLESSLLAAAESAGRSDVLVELGRTALVRAGELRERHRFGAPRDYPELAIDLLRAPASLGARAGGAALPAVAILGGGLLGQSVARLAARMFPHVVLVTRAPKKARKKLDPALGITITTPSQASAALTGTAYRCFAATEPDAGGGRGDLLELFHGALDAGVVDFSATPFLARSHPGYVTLYGERFAEALARSNAAVAPAAARIQAELAGAPANVLVEVAP